MVSSVPDDNFQMDFGAKQCSFGGEGGGYWCVFFSPEGRRKFWVFLGKGFRGFGSVLLENSVLECAKHSPEYAKNVPQPFSQRLFFGPQNFFSGDQKSPGSGIDPPPPTYPPYKQVYPQKKKFWGPNPYGDPFFLDPPFLGIPLFWDPHLFGIPFFLGSPFSF